MNTLFIFNASPAQSEPAYHGLRVANALARNGEPVRIFLFADGAHLANHVGGTLDVAELMASLAENNVAIGACAACLDARDIKELAPPVVRGTLDDVTNWTTWAGKVLVY